MSLSRVRVPRWVFFILQAIAFASAASDPLLRRFCESCWDLANDVGQGIELIPNDFAQYLTPSGNPWVILGLMIFLNLLAIWAILRFVPKTVSLLVFLASVVAWVAASVIVIVIVFLPLILA